MEKPTLKFYNIGELTKEWGEVDRVLGVSETQELLLWQAKTQLAIAQQLSVISGTLRDFYNLCEGQINVQARHAEETPAKSTKKR